MLIAVLFTAGAWALQQQAQLPPLAAAFLVVPLVLAARTWGRADHRGLRAAGRVAGLVVWLAGGLFWAALQATWRLSDELPFRVEGRDVSLSGIVASLPEASESGWRYVLEVDRVITPGMHVPQRVLLTLGADAQEPVEGFDPPVRSGDRLTFTARFKRPHGTYNPHGFDFEAWMLERSIRATGYVRAGEPFTREPPSGFDPGKAVDRIRADIRTRMLRALPDSPEVAVLVALAIGDQQGISRDQWQTYTRTGVNHLMSISGLHITMLAGLAALAAGRTWRMSGRLVRAAPARDVGAWVGLLVAAGYALLAGFAVPAQRTLWMLAAVTVARRLRMTTSSWDVLGLALLVVVAMDPMCVIAPGFWLSFGAVALLIFTGDAARTREAPWIRWSRAQWAMFVGLAPLLIALFQQVSLIGPVANAVAVPVVSLVVAPLSLVAAMTPWPGPPAEAAQWCLAGLHAGLRWLADLPYASYTQHEPPAWALLLGGVGVIWLLLPRGIPSRWLGGLALLPIAWARPAGPEPGEAWVTMLDVGQGLAVLVRVHSEVLLFDAGPAWSGEADSASRVIGPFLRGEGVRRVDALVVSHDDRDHTGGVATLLSSFPVGRVLTSLDPAHPLFQGRGTVIPCVAGQSWSRDGVSFAMLHPFESQAPVPVRDNARSCVLRVSTPGGAVLIAADIERGSEERLVASGVSPQSEILVVPHHGSRTSSTPAFIDAVAPGVAWFPVGYRNRFRHPHPDIVSRYRDRGVRMFRSDSAGAVTAYLSPVSVRLESWRRERPRYWHSQEDHGSG
jgi:competence protein ComEC